MKRIVAKLFGIVAVLLLPVAPAQALTPVDSCGQMLSTAGEYVLTGNLDCSGTGTNGINITASNVVVHLAGRTILNTGCDTQGIFVQIGISGVQIDGGTVSGFLDGIALNSSSSRVRGMNVTRACVFGMVVSGQNNQVDTNVVSANGLDGIGLQLASGTLITSNDISGNVRLGVDISNFSDNNVVEKNIINNNGAPTGEGGGVAIFVGTNNVIRNNAVNNNSHGILIESPMNAVTDNTVNGSSGDGSSGVGIFIGTDGAPSVVTGNTVLGSSRADMSDASAGCNGNTWASNTYETADQPCIR